MDLAGKLETMGLADLLQMLAQTRRSGALQVTDGGSSKFIYFDHGAVISAGSSAPVEQLGHFLVSHHLINEEQLARAIGAQEQRHDLLGRILVTQGAIDQASLDHMLRLKAEECIYDLFSWTRGAFEFHSERLLEHDPVPQPLEVQELLLEGMQRIDEWQNMREHIPSPQCVPVAVVEDLASTAGGASEREILTQVDDQSSVEEICLRTHSSEYFVCRVLYRAKGEGRLKIVRPRALGARPGDGGAPNAPASAGDLLTLADDLIAAGDLVRAYRHLRAATVLEPAKPAITTAVAEQEQKIRDLVSADGVLERQVPRLVTDFKKLAELEISPTAGFVISRVNGLTDVASILKVSPMPPLEALLVFWQLQRAGHLVLAEPVSTELATR